MIRTKLTSSQDLNISLMYLWDWQESKFVCSVGVERVSHRGDDQVFLPSRDEPSHQGHWKTISITMITQLSTLPLLSGLLCEEGCLLTCLDRHDSILMTYIRIPCCKKIWKVVSCYWPESQTNPSARSPTKMALPPPPLASTCEEASSPFNVIL